MPFTINARRHSFLLTHSAGGAECPNPRDPARNNRNARDAQGPLTGEHAGRLPAVKAAVVLEYPVTYRQLWFCHS